MASLIHNIPQNTTLPQMHTAPRYNTNNVSYATQPQVGLSPEAKSTLWSGAMCGVLGGVWGAKPKFDAEELIRLEDDTFTKVTKKLQNSNDTAFIDFLTTRKKINNKIKLNAEFFFGDKSEISKEDLLKKLGETSEETLEKNAAKLEKQLEKIKEIDVETFFDKTNNYRTLNKEQKEKLKTALGENLFEEINKQQPQDIKKFISNKQDLLDRKRFGLVLCDTATDNKIIKSYSEIFTNKKTIEQHAEDINNAYKNICAKLPKERIKTAAKWFGAGIITSILLNAFFGAIKNRKVQK